MAFTDSDAFGITVTAAPTPGDTPDFPAWATAIAPGAWADATTNTLSAVASVVNPQYVIEVLRSYNGAAKLTPETYSTHGGLLCWGGGHSSQGYDSSIYIIDVGSREWILQRTGYTGPFNSGGAGTYPAGEFPNGDPVPTHTYCYPGYDPVNGLFFMPRSASSYTASTTQSNTTSTFVYDIAGDDWYRGPNWPDSLREIIDSGGRTVWDDRRQCFWCMPASSQSTATPRVWAKFENLTNDNGDGTFGTLTTYNYSGATLFESDLVLIPGATADDDLLIWWDFSSSTKRLYASRIVGGIPQARVVLTMGGQSPAVLHKTGSLNWCARRNSLIYYDNRQPDPTTGGFAFIPGFGRALVFELKAPADKLNGTWTWGILTTTANTYVPPQHNTNSGVYSKARLFEYVGGELLVVALTANDPACAFRVP